MRLISSRRLWDESGDGRRRRRRRGRADLLRGAVETRAGGARLAPGTGQRRRERRSRYRRRVQMHRRRGIHEIR